MKQFVDIVAPILRALQKQCPRLVREYYWAGTSSIAAEELGHRASFDLDFHTLKALHSVRPLYNEMKAILGRGFQTIQAPDESGSGFRGKIRAGRQWMTIEVLSNYDDVSSRDLVRSKIAPAFRRISLQRYLKDKIQCIVERTEARDLVDVAAVLRKNPRLVGPVRKLVGEFDRVMFVERLLAWTDKSIAADLKAYRDVNPGDASATRDMLLTWLTERDK